MFQKIPMASGDRRNGRERGSRGSREGELLPLSGAPGPPVGTVGPPPSASASTSGLCARDKLIGLQGPAHNPLGFRTCLDQRGRWGRGTAALPLGQVGPRSSLAPLMPMHLGEALRPQVPPRLPSYPPTCWLRVSLEGTPQRLDSDHRRTWVVILCIVGAYELTQAKGLQ